MSRPFPAAHALAAFLTALLAPLGALAQAEPIVPLPIEVKLDARKVALGDALFQVFGVMGDYFARRPASEADLGRFNVTKQETDRHVFKVPSLRNVAATAPYFHDGSAETLEDAVDVMFRYQLGRPAPVQDKALIVKFLHTLTGEYRGKPLQP